MNKVGLGGSCHWCTEAIFQSIEGVIDVEQGWIAAKAPNEDFSEAVVVHFNPAQVSLHNLIEIHLLSHSATSSHNMRAKYRSAVYVYNKTQYTQSIRILAELQIHFANPLITQTLLFDKFEASATHYQNYYKKDPSRPFCQNIIQPKLDKLKRYLNHRS
ncbi:peptide-methionine (S)-S-oxide reductase [Paraglaciecola polaris]|uniref:peptide-methionine (S)-S-oxide reductase n=1 Tax=Paraglaciecola polaris LMG 21857 TaxID=1129793 RepID=K6ZT37_9ALTE|nr:peptide-methionine (S)-S-oxide reductase [Paraglaciecola polaris]GAC31993.1 hypothetical protein GPLA_1078 [Paraglaciecola polaris LMG 21857]|tara:strand:+ start:5301 stop:5777 length:477 start_codon:yes stop_codon:yes gene_type:complete